MPIDDFFQGERNEGLPATERTEVRVLFDRRHLFIGIRCFDREPELADARGVFRDRVVSADDLVMIMLDAFNDQRSAIQFATNMNGHMVDLLQTGESSSTRNINWDTVWSAKGSSFDDGWQVEVAIPFTALRFAPPAPGEPVIFGIGFKRNIPRKNEEVVWPFVSNDSSWYRPAELGKLTGLHDIEPGHALEIRPYVLGDTERRYAPDGAAPDVDVDVDVVARRELGVDAKWGVTSGLTADFTVNTDFAQEEADVQQLNFTRSSLFFPEKRQFFLEGQRMFDFGISREADLVFTRRIGLSSTGGILPLLGGARLSGRQGRYSIGAMNIQTGDEALVPAENFTVVRVRRDFLSRSSLGAVLTNRSRG